MTVYRNKKNADIRSISTCDIQLNVPALHIDLVPAEVEVFVREDLRDLLEELLRRPDMLQPGLWNRLEFIRIQPSKKSNPDPSL